MDILKLAQRYNEFQNDVGQFLISDMDETISALFSPSFKKIANGSVLVAKREELKDQLTSVLEQAGKWLIDVKETLVFQNSQKCLIHYKIKTDKLGVFEIMAILSGSSSGLIEEIEEIYYQK